MIADFPMHYQSVDDIREGYRRCVFEKYSIYFMIDGDSVHIMRILRAQAIEKELHS